MQDLDEILQEIYLTIFFLQVLQEKYLQDLHISCKTVFTGQLFVKNGILYRLFNGTEGFGSMMQLVVPDSLKEEILYGVHEGIGGGHLGVEKSVAKLKERYYWSGHYNDVKSWCANCGSCITRKATSSSPITTSTSRISYGDGRRRYYGPFPKNQNGNCYILF